jgi:hypothetical protein
MMGFAMSFSVIFTCSLHFLSTTVSGVLNKLIEIIRVVTHSDQLTEALILKDQAILPVVFDECFQAKVLFFNSITQ